MAKPLPNATHKFNRTTVFGTTDGDTTLHGSSLVNGITVSISQSIKPVTDCGPNGNPAGACKISPCLTTDVKQRLAMNP